MMNDMCHHYVMFRGRSPTTSGLSSLDKHIYFTSPLVASYVQSTEKKEPIRLFIFGASNVVKST